MAKMETELTYIKEATTNNHKENNDAHKEISNKIDNFINTANKIYATKKEVDEVKRNMKDNKNNNASWLQKLVPTPMGIAMLVVAGINVYLLWGRN